MIAPAATATALKPIPISPIPRTSIWPSGSRPRWLRPLPGTGGCHHLERPSDALLLRVDDALHLVDHFIDLLLDLTSLTIRLSLCLQVLVPGQVSDGLFGLALD